MEEHLACCLLLMIKQLNLLLRGKAETSYNIKRIFIVLNVQSLKKTFNLYSSCIDCSFKNFETIDKEKLIDLLKV